VPRGERARLKALPGAVELRDRTVAIDYDVEETAAGVVGVARLRMPEKLARTLVAEELPVLDRPLRFQVLRGARGSVKAATLDELQGRLDDPFTDDERRDANRRGRNGDRGRGSAPNRGTPRRGDSRGERGGRGDHPPGGRGSGGNPWTGARGGDSRDAGRHRPGSPSGRGKRRGK
jgi:hypothetical protein